MDSNYAWTVIAIMCLATYLPRGVPLLLLAHRSLPRWFTLWLTFVPTAIFGALVVPDVLLVNGEFNFTLNNYALLTTVIILYPVLRSKSLGISVASGAAIFALLQYFLG